MHWDSRTSLCLSGQSPHNTLKEITTDDRCHMAKQGAQLIIKIHAVALPPGIGPLSADENYALALMTFHSFVSTRIAELRAYAQQQDPPDRLHYSIATLLPETFSSYTTRIEGGQSEA